MSASNVGRGQNKRRKRSVVHPVSRSASRLSRSSHYSRFFFFFCGEPMRSNGAVHAFPRWMLPKKNPPRSHAPRTEWRVLRGENWNWNWLWLGYRSGVAFLGCEGAGRRDHQVGRWVGPWHLGLGKDKAPHRGLGLPPPPPPPSMLFQTSSPSIEKTSLLLSIHRDGN